jgi:hypothetical protein
MTQALYAHMCNKRKKRIFQMKEYGWLKPPTNDLTSNPQIQMHKEIWIKGSMIHLIVNKSKIKDSDDSKVDEISKVSKEWLKEWLKQTQINTWINSKRIQTNKEDKAGYELGIQ